VFLAGQAAATSGPPKGASLLPLPPAQRQQNVDRGPPDRYFRTQICQRWREGTCRNGAACTFAHGEEALRAPRPRPAAAPGERPEAPRQQGERTRWEVRACRCPLLASSPLAGCLWLRGLAGGAGLVIIWFCLGLACG
jgi:hypothetical protein